MAESKDSSSAGAKRKQKKQVAPSKKQKRSKLGDPYDVVRAELKATAKLIDEESNKSDTVDEIKARLIAMKVRPLHNMARSVSPYDLLEQPETAQQYAAFVEQLIMPPETNWNHIITRLCIFAESYYCTSPSRGPYAILEMSLLLRLIAASKIQLSESHLCLQANKRKSFVSAIAIAIVGQRFGFQWNFFSAQGIVNACAKQYSVSLRTIFEAIGERGVMFSCRVFSNELPVFAVVDYRPWLIRCDHQGDDRNTRCEFVCNVNKTRVAHRDRVLSVCFVLIPVQALCPIIMGYAFEF